jgi:Fe-S cluster biogenesis protein NfuA
MNPASQRGTRVNIISGDRMRKEVEKALSRIRPALQAHGGDVELVEVTNEGVVKVRLIGTCRGCPMSTMTLEMGIAQELKKEVPGVKEVKAI